MKPVNAAAKAIVGAVMLQALVAGAYAQSTNPVAAGNAEFDHAGILIPGQEWRVAADNMRSTDGPAVNQSGEIFFNDGRSGKTMKIALDGTITEFVANSQHGAGQAFGPDGRLFAVAMGANEIVAYDKEAKPTVIADGIYGNDLVVAANGGVYVTESPKPATPDSGKLWYINPQGEKKIVDKGVKFYNGLTLSPDQSALYAGDYRGHWVYSYRIGADGSLADKKEFCDLYVPVQAKDSAADGMRADEDGRVYVTTRSGIQVCDQYGEIVAIIRTPSGRVSNLSFGGANFDVLYATCGDKVYMRTVNAKGALPFEAPIKTAKKP
ncbi:MAG: SMP-30/gluconolactonase/LRE family protein [Tepidisphaeraceae bacterium]|jgi:sugar lactone lactonase YvrE